MYKVQKCTWYCTTIFMYTYFSFIIQYSYSLSLLFPLCLLISLEWTSVSHCCISIIEMGKEKSKFFLFSSIFLHFSHLLFSFLSFLDSFFLGYLFHLLLAYIIIYCKVFCCSFVFMFCTVSTILTESALE